MTTSAWPVPNAARHKRSNTSRLAWVALATILALFLNLAQGILPGTSAPAAQAHNLQTRMVYMYMDPATQADARRAHGRAGLDAAGRRCCRWAMRSG